MNSDIPLPPGYSHVSAPPSGPPLGGPQLTEYTGNRIANALERIADAMERAEKGRPAEWADRPYRDTTGQPPYPLGDPGPLGPRPRRPHPMKGFPG